MFNLSQSYKVECTSEVNGVKVYEIGRWFVELHPDGEVRYRPARRDHKGPLDVFPNMDVSDGMLRIPLDDMIEAIVNRADPVDLARALWANEDVRNHLMEEMALSYGDMPEAQKVEFLTKIKESVHSTALTRAVNAVMSFEHSFGRKWYFYHEVNRINEYLYEKGIDVRLKHEDHDENFRIGGKWWEEARKHWREELKSMFPGPEEKSE